MNIDDLAQQVGAWLRGTGPMHDIVISSRVRLARNLAGFPFLIRAGEDDRRMIFRELTTATGLAGFDQQALMLDIDELAEIDRQGKGTCHTSA